MKKKLLTILIILIFCFIWGNSMVPEKQSNAISDAVTAMVGGVVTHCYESSERAATTWFTSGHIRKLAHVTEYAALGAVLTTLVILKHKTIRGHLPGLALAGLSVAVIDETIQMFNNRTSQIKDVWIDSAGFALGTGLTILIARFTRFLAQQKKQKK
ncbi:MAG: VanZ family protein [Intestinimonas sp.]|jgi:VanZ family protein|nr:VanZ family protein [Intestinimonas sp.]